MATSGQSATTGSTAEYWLEMNDNAASTVVAATNDTLSLGSATSVTANTSIIQTGNGSFDLADAGYVKINQNMSTLINTKTFTMALTLQKTDTPDAYCRLISDPSQNFRLRIGSTTSVIELLWAGSTIFSTNTGTDLADGTSRTITLKADGTNATFYIGSTSAASGSITSVGTVADSTLLAIGSSTDGTSWNGIISDFKLWNTAETP